VLAKLGENGFIWSTGDSFIRAENYTTISVRKSADVLLKLDFVNDNAPVFGEIKGTSLFYQTDSVRNILSNKLSAIFRYAAKDVADIREIAKRESVDWTQAILEARQKEAGIELVYVSDVMTKMPKDEFEKVAWVKKPDWEEFREDIAQIAYEMLTK
jgi:hypothetical protein